MITVSFSRKQRKFEVSNSSIFRIDNVPDELQKGSYLFISACEAISFATILARIFRTRCVIRYKSFPIAEGFVLNQLFDSGINLLKTRKTRF